MSADLEKTLLDGIRRSARAARFCCGGTLPVASPQITVANLGVIRFPLNTKSAKSLMEQCYLAPYGKGTQTLVNTRVRKTLELAPSSFEVTDEWNAAIAEVTRKAAIELGLPPDELHASLYKLLIYKVGGFFLAHRDSEKNDRMVASLVVVLPGSFRGGSLIVRHNASLEQRFAFEEAASGKCSSFAAFYADCEHEVKPVESGLRVCLTYNLILNPKRTRKATASKSSRDGSLLLPTIQSWFAARPTKPLVFALEHHYTERGLSTDLLKGADRQLAECLIPLALQAGCHVHLAHVSRHLCQFADDGNWTAWGRDSWGAPRSKPAKLQIGESYEDSLLGTEWTTPTGKKQRWGSMPLEIASIVSRIPMDDWKPTSEEYEGYTGNAGNTLDRWYHRSAIVLWPQAHHFEVLAACGPTTCIPLFLQMMSKLEKATKLRKEESRTECVAFARAIIPTWRVTYHPRYDSESDGEGNLIFEQFRDQLPGLDDLETIVLFLRQIAKRDRNISLGKLITHVCRKFGAASLAPELRLLLTVPADQRRRQDLAVRDTEWLVSLCEATTADAESRELVRELCRQAVDRFCEPFPQQTGYGWHRAGTGTSSAPVVLEQLLKALLFIGGEKALGQVIRFVSSNPDHFTLEQMQVPVLTRLMPWTLKRFTPIPEPLARWLQLVRNELEAATAVEPRPPTDWSRPAPTYCQCEYCAQLRTVLQDSGQASGRISAREDAREHLISEINRRGYDVTYKLEKLKSPYSLVLTKTLGSYERAVEIFRKNQKLLQSLP